MTINTVYILGAGASKDAGGPLVKDFFSRNDASIKTIHEKYFDKDNKYQILQSAYNQWSQHEQDPSVESFFNRLEFQKLIGKNVFIDGLGREVETSTLYRYLTWYIASMVRNSISYKRNMPSHYATFADKLWKRGIKSSIISFNYDLIIENEIKKIGRTINYHLYATGKNKPFYLNKDGMSFLKLHGSLNWMWCPECGSISLKDEPMAQKYNRIRCLVKCGGMKEGLIIPPNINKTPYLESIDNLWKSADNKLSKANKIVIIGYSLPNSDYAAKELLSEPSRNVDDLVIVSNSKQTAIDVQSKLGAWDNCTLFYNGFKEYVNNVM